MNDEKAKLIIRTIKTFAQNNSDLSTNEIRIIVALERAIARLIQNKQLETHLIFKGGFVLLKNHASVRFTRDVDALAVAIPKDKLKDQLCDALSIDMNDGLWFGDIKVKELTEQGEYGGYRFDFAFQIGKPDPQKIHKLSRIHFDIGFSDILTKQPENQMMRSVLELEEPISWRIYPLEYILSEKIQTLIDRGSANSRAKDIYDIIYLFPRCENINSLISAMQTTFKNRETIFPKSFHEEANRIDKTILKAAWPNTKIMVGKLEFEEVWQTLLEHLKYLDEKIRSQS